MTALSFIERNLATGIVINTELSLFKDKVSFVTADTNLGKRIFTSYSMSETIKMLNSKKIIKFKIDSVIVNHDDKVYDFTNSTHTTPYNLKALFGNIFSNSSVHSVQGE